MKSVILVNVVSENKKTEIRVKTLTALRNQKEEDRFKNSLVILEKLLAVTEFQKSKTILFYASFDGEVDTWPMMKRALNLGKQIALPKIIPTQKKIIPMLISDLQTDLYLGPYGIRQPLDSCRPVKVEELDLVVVPGVAFDRRNRRLGRGGGYYDRFLADLSPQTPKIGLAFDFQIVDRFPVDAHDVAVTRVICN